MNGRIATASYFPKFTSSTQTIIYHIKPRYHGHLSYSIGLYKSIVHVLWDHILGLGTNQQWRKVQNGSV